MSKGFDDLSAAQKNEVARLNQLQQQLEMMTQQRMSMENQIKELEFAVKELTDAGENAVAYKSIAGMFVKKDQKKLLQESKDRKETLEMRVKALVNQEDRFKKQFEELRTKVQGFLDNK
jgi:prefoldin beta subunit